MAAQVQDIYQALCYALLEDNGLVLGLLTQAQFIDLCNLALIEFCKETSINLDIFTQTVGAGVSKYTIPNSTMRVDDVFLAGVYVEQSDVQALNNNRSRWRYTLGPPTNAWHSDELPPNTIELVLTPNYDGAFLRGTAFPAPPNGQYRTDFLASVETAPGVFTLQTPDVHRDLTTIGPQFPAAVAALGDPLPFPDDIALAYVVFGVLERVFSSDNELRDPQRALWCHAQFWEGCQLLKSIFGEPGDD